MVHKLYLSIETTLHLNVCVCPSVCNVAELIDDRQKAKLRFFFRIFIVAVYNLLHTPSLHFPFPSNSLPWPIPFSLLQPSLILTQRRILKFQNIRNDANLIFKISSYFLSFITFFPFSLFFSFILSMFHGIFCCIMPSICLL